MAKPNLILIGIDSLRRDRMSLYGYNRLTTPHIDRYAAGGTVFEKPFSPSIPTTPGYASMLTGMDCFGTDVVALRHEGAMHDDVTTLAEVLRDSGYESTCVGFQGNPASRGFDNYIQFEGWGSDETGRSPKAEALNAVTIPELKRLAGESKPFFLFMRHMDPHSPYLPPRPFERIFYDGNEFDPANTSMKPVFEFEPFADYFRSWMPDGITDVEYENAQYDGAIAYMDAAIANIFQSIRDLEIDEETLVIITSDHGETLDEHECYFDHHGLYDCTLVVPLVFRMPGVVPAGARIPDACQVKDIMPTTLELLGIETKIEFDGRSLVPWIRAEEAAAGAGAASGPGIRGSAEARGFDLRSPEPEFYITEATWMRKHGWRTPEWKLIHALEPDLHGKPEVELYNLIEDPEETVNLAEKRPEVVAHLEERMQAHIEGREKATGRTNPMYTNLNWHGKGTGPFKSSEEAYNAMHIGSRSAAAKLQDKEKAEQSVKSKDSGGA
jgi:arylsulfatase A-like enzyme